MQHIDSTAIEAVNKGVDTPDAFYYKSTLIGTSEYVKTDGWRGYHVIKPEEGFKIIKDSWLTGDWSDAPYGHSESEVQKTLDRLEKKHGDIYVIFTPTSNVFSTSYTVLVRDEKQSLNKGKAVAHKTRKFEDDEGFKIRYHATDVISYNKKTGKYTLKTGGWHTRTTHSRINEYLPNGYRVFAKQGETMLSTPDGTQKLEEGMTI
jgi:hypothetical protein